MRICFNCRAELSSRERVPLKELCPKCEAFLHCCKNCRLYSADAHNHCLSTTTEFVPDVERGNYCDEFDFREIQVEPKVKPARQKKSGGSSSSSSADQAALGNGDSKSQSARDKFNNLFKD
jgi:hypothetical protein